MPYWQDNKNMLTFKVLFTDLYGVIFTSKLLALLRKPLQLISQGAIFTIQRLYSLLQLFTLSLERKRNSSSI